MSLQLIERAFKFSSEEFLKLVEDVVKLQEECLKKGRVGEVEVKGGVLNIPRGGKLVVVGDLHGDFQSLSYILKHNNLVEEESKVVFLGDYGDRGIHQAEVYYMVLWLKREHPERIFLLRGNHEGPPDLMASPHDLPFVLQKRLRMEGYRAYASLRKLFDKLSLVAIVEGCYVLLHGGAPSLLNSIEDLYHASKLHPYSPMLEEILWNDPMDEEGTHPSFRGAGKLFGPDVTMNLLKLTNTKVLVRGHEPCSMGVEVRHGGRLLTLFSRKGPPYMNLKAAYLKLDLAQEPLDAYEMAKRAEVF